MFAAAAASAGISILGDIFQASEESKKSGREVENLELSKQQDQLVFKERHLKRLDNLKTIVNSNIALAGFRGISPASGSFKAIEQKSFADFNEDENMDNLNLKFKEQYIDEQEKAIQEESFGKEVAPFFKTASDLFKFTGL
ncbi:MAG: hypothetical protein V3V84_00735 [Candidatus Bathyarchaeia archaeon]